MSDDGTGFERIVDRNAASSWLSRRTFLAAGLVGLAGCNGIDDGIDTPTMTGSPRGTDAPGGETWTPAELGLRVAPPGEVQETIDEVEGTYSRVLLSPDATYDPSAPWEIKNGVTLDYNGAHVELSSDVDLHDVHPGGRIDDPVVDLRSVSGGYSSSVFVFDSARHGFYGDDRIWHVRGGVTRGRVGEGTLYEFRQGNENAIYFVHADHAVRGIGTAVEMHRGDEFGINGNRIFGLWYGFETGIHMYNRGRPDQVVDNFSGNHFDVIAQPTDSEILWDLEAGRFNVLQGRLWDFNSYDDVMWRIHGENAQRRYGNLLRWFPVGGTREHLLETIGPQVFDDRLGDPRNRVVIPWLQGLAVRDFR